MITLKNEVLTVTIAEMGAEMRSLQKTGVDYLWSGDAAWWSSCAPMMFPICGGLKDDLMLKDGKSYTLPKHGFARKQLFTVESAADTTATFLLTDNEETRAMYPYAFALRVTYTLCGDTVKVDWDVENTGNEQMYYCIGAHEAYACPEGIEAYDIVFDHPVSLLAHPLDGNLVLPETTPVLQNSDTLALKEDFFSIDALVFSDINWSAATLRNRETGRGVRVEFAGFPHMLLWQKHRAPYICIEPWHGIQDGLGSDNRLEHKDSIIALEPGKTRRTTHSIQAL